MKQPPAQVGIVLVVDDDAAVRNSLKFSLEIEGFEVRAYGNVYEFLSLENLPVPACLIVNYNMPAINGLEVVARLRDRGISIPTILVTGHANENLRRRAATAGVSVVEKPFLGSHLIDSLRHGFDQLKKNT